VRGARDVETFPQFSAFPTQSVCAALQSISPVAQFSAFEPKFSTLQGDFSAKSEFFSAYIRIFSAFLSWRLAKPEMNAENYLGVST